MSEKDLSEKILADYNDVFSDIINVYIFHGEKKVCPEDLENTSVHSQYKADDDRLHELERDVAKYWNKGKVQIVLFGFENQTVSDRNMPFRIIGYDGASYRSQLLQKKTDISPVITLVLYFGTDRKWDQPCSLKQLLQIPDGLEPFVNDYQIHVINVAWTSDDQLKKFASDFGIVANFFVKKRKNKNYIPDDRRTIQHVDEVLKLLSVMSGDDRYADLNSKKGIKVTNMCDVAERLVQQGMEQGMKQGMEQGMEQGRINTLYELVCSGIISIEVAARKLDQTTQQVLDGMHKAGFSVPK